MRPAAPSAEPAPRRGVSPTAYPPTGVRSRRRPHPAPQVPGRASPLRRPGRPAPRAARGDAHDLVTTVLVGTTSAGRISATTCLASCFEQWKNFATPWPGSPPSSPWRAGDVRDAEPSVSKGLGDLREPPEEPGRDLAVVGRTHGTARPPGAGSRTGSRGRAAARPRACRTPRGRAGDRRGRSSRRRDRFGDAEGPFACVHASTISREFRPSPNARNRLPARIPAPGSRTPPGIAARRPCAKCGAASTIPAAPRPRHRHSPGSSSTDYE